MQQFLAQIQKIKAKILEFYYSKFLPNLSRILFALSIIIIILFVSLYFSALPPKDFPLNKIVTIEKGMSLSEISSLLEDEHLIKSKTTFKVCAVLSGIGKGTMAGDYLFQKPVSACKIADRIIRGVFGIPTVKVTIPEGSSNKEISLILEKNLSGFNAPLFEEGIANEEGYLFPDTYLFSSRASEKDVEKALNDNFQTKIAPLQSDIAKSGHSEKDIIIMASILEREARTPEDQAIVSGILWKRIAISVPLQVDAPFYYLLGKESNELTISDFKTKSPYNTSTILGLPEGQIGNPGLQAIRAAIFPKKTDFLYYLSDKNGVMHYAKTFEEHKANKSRYL